MRRKYELGKCQDCGHLKRTTVVIFWVSGMRYRLCSNCRRAYDQQLFLKACKPDCMGCAKVGQI